MFHLSCSRIWSFVLAAALMSLAAMAAAAHAAAATEPGPTTVTIAIKNFKFVPSSVTVAPGTTVRWKNEDELAHTATSNKGVFDSGNLDQGKTYAHTFAKAGKYEYVCAYHSSMTATVIVAAPSASPTS